MDSNHVTKNIAKSECKEKKRKKNNPLGQNMFHGRSLTVFFCSLVHPKIVVAGRDRQVIATDRSII